jgi:hypothetical protein
MQRILLILLLIFLSEFRAGAQTCCSGGVPLSSNLGMPPGDKGTWQFNVSYDQNVLKTLKEGSNELNDNSRERITRSVLSEVGYGFTNRFAVDLFFSFINQERTINQFGNTDITSTHGFGDMVVHLKYRITKPEDSRHNLLVGIGPKIPTARTDFTRDDGIILNADLQPGSGAWDALLYGFYNRSFGFRPSMGFSVSMVYGYKGVNPDYLNGQSYRFGNEFLGQLSVVEKLNLGKQIFDFGLTLRYRYQGNDEFNIAILPNTGGQFLFLTPGISYYITSKLTANVSSEIPIYTKVEGTQLAPTYRFSAGMFLVINRKRKMFEGSAE